MQKVAQVTQNLLGIRIVQVVYLATLDHSIEDSSPAKVTYKELERDVRVVLGLKFSTGQVLEETKNSFLGRLSCRSNLISIFLSVDIRSKLLLSDRFSKASQRR